jgi:hypothetical protein
MDLVELNAALSRRAGARTEVRQPIHNERIDEVSIIVVRRDFRHGAIMLLLQLTALCAASLFLVPVCYDLALCPQKCIQGDTVRTAEIAAHPTLHLS